MIAPIDGSLSFDYTKQRYTSQQPDALSIMKEITEFYLKKKGLPSYLVFNKCTSNYNYLFNLRNIILYAIYSENYLINNTPVYGLSL